MQDSDIQIPRDLQNNPWRWFETCSREAWSNWFFENEVHSFERPEIIGSTILYTCQWCSQVVQVSGCMNANWLDSSTTFMELTRCLHTLHQCPKVRCLECSNLYVGAQRP
jgi:hypothetical protein